MEHNNNINNVNTNDNISALGATPGHHVNTYNSLIMQGNIIWHATILIILNIIVY